jgi:CD36 family
LVQPIDDISLFQDVPRVFIPAMWFEQKFVMDEEMAQQVKIAVKIPRIGQLAGLIMLVIGIILTIISYLMSCIQSRKSSNRQQMEINLGERQLEERQKKEVSPLLNRKLVRPQILQHKRETVP